MSSERNPHEISARETKVRAIVTVLDAAFAASAIAPSSLKALRLVIWAEPTHFVTAAQIAGVRAPSAKTIAAIVEFYRRRHALLDSAHVNA